jgi:hypothetical protein
VSEFVGACVVIASRRIPADVKGGDRRALYGPHAAGEVKIDDGAR